MLEQPLDFIGYSNIQFFDSPPSPDTVSEAAWGYLLLTQQRLCDLGTPYHATGHQVLPTQPLSREKEDFPRDEMYFNYVPLLT